MYISVIIPYYNSAKYIQDAVDSVNQSTFTKNIAYEIIIVNDGSTEDGTAEVLQALAKNGCRVYSQANGGPASARNKGISLANGEYLLFLDSDNKIKSNYIEIGIDLLLSNKIDVVYGKPVFFGDSDVPRFRTDKFDINKIIVRNYIDICCILKKEVCVALGGFDEEPKIIGMEDWEFYIRLYGAGYRIHYIDNEVYYYRVLKSSLSQQNNSVTRNEACAYIYAKHAALVHKTLLWHRDEYDKYTFDQHRPLRSGVKYFYKKYIPARVRSVVSNIFFS